MIIKEQERLWLASVFNKNPDIFTIKVDIPGDLELSHAPDFIGWAEENLKGAYHFDLRHVWFVFEEDAVLFKLTWN